MTTQDWHVEPGEHFTKHAVHCVAGSAGTELDPKLSEGADTPIASLIDLTLRKGLYSDGYSAFEAISESGRVLPDLLAEHGIRAIDVCGLAENGCVAATVRDAIAAEMPVRLLTDLSAARSPEAAAKAEAEMAAAGAVVITSADAWPVTGAARQGR